MTDRFPRQGQEPIIPPLPPAQPSEPTFPLTEGYPERKGSDRPFYDDIDKLVPEPAPPATPPATDQQ